MKSASFCPSSRRTVFVYVCMLAEVVLLVNT